ARCAVRRPAVCRGTDGYVRSEWWRRGGEQGCRLRPLLSQLLNLGGPKGAVLGGHLRSPAVPRQGYWQGASLRAREDCSRAELRPNGVVRTGLERERDRLLPVAGRRAHGGLDHLQAWRERFPKALKTRNLMRPLS